MKLLSVLLLLLPMIYFGQSIHETELTKYNAFGQDNANYWELSPRETNIIHQKKSCTLDQVVYGWHPYWMGSSYTNYDWDLLSHFSFFSYEVDANTGNANSTHGWSTSLAVDAALASGNTKVTLCVTLFSNHTVFFSNATSRQTLITNLINLVQNRGAHGVQIDFEGIPNSQKTNFANWMVDLSLQMKAAIPGAEVSTVLYAVDWNDVFDFSIMEPHVDHYIIMGYAYYYQGSSSSGPCDPLYHFGSTYNYSLSRTITYYLDKGCPSDKLVMGLPYYGYEWSTTSNSVPSGTTGSGSARTYASVRNNSSGNFIPANYYYDQDSYSDAYSFNTGTPTQTFITLESSFRKRLEHIRTTGIAGMGIWALGYDDGYLNFWDAISDYMTDCYESPCTGEIHDFGGPYKNYYDNEDYTWTIAPLGASNISINFTEFDVELDYDYLYIYDGYDSTAPQIPGSPFTGTTSPSSFTTSGGSVTFRFYSDGATTAPGFYATYSCSTTPPPSAGFTYTSTGFLCRGDSIQLINSSSNATTYQWITPSGITISDSSDVNPWIFPSSGGSFTVTLIASNTSSSDTISNTLAITLINPPIASATSNLSNTTVGTPIFFTNLSANSSNYSWDFGDGAQSNAINPSHSYIDTGSYSVMLIASNGICNDDTTYIPIVINEPTALVDLNADLEIYPNPTKGILYHPRVLTPLNYQIYDVTGQLIMTGQSDGIISLQALCDGTYYIRWLNRPLGLTRIIKLQH